MMYFIQATAYSVLLYLVYLIFFRNRTSHKRSRAYLLTNIAVPFVLPLIDIPLFQRQDNSIAEIMLPAVSVGTNVAASDTAASLLPILYISVSATLLGYLLSQLARITLFLQRHECENHKGYRLVRNTGIGPGSWFRYIFLPGNDTDAAILEHELAHVKLKHSYDILFLRLGQCLAWPNLFIFVIARELKAVHEFQADEAAAKQHSEYSRALLNGFFDTKQFSLSHTFFHHPVKRRIMMLQKKRTPAGLLRATTLFLLMITGMLYIQCSRDSVGHTTSQNPERAKDAAGIYTSVDKLPEFIGQRHLFDHMLINLRYPEEAKSKNTEGRVEVKFVIDEYGNLSNPTVISSPDELLSNEVLRVVSDMKKWSPAEVNGKKVRAYFTLPIEFKMDMPAPEPYDQALRKQMLIGNGRRQLTVTANGC